MRPLALARVEVAGVEPYFRWCVFGEGDARDGWTILDEGGRASTEGHEGVMTALATVPRGAPVRVVLSSGREQVAVVQHVDRLETAGERPGETVASIAPVQLAGAAPGASGPALVASRTELRRAPVDARRAALRSWTELYRGVSTAGIAAACALDIAVLPHQLAVARAALSAPTVRHVLADEVGLGKTIEALMIWSALRSMDPRLTTVIAAPRSVIPQWCLEVRRRAEHGLFKRRFEDLVPIVVARGDEPLEALDRFDRRGLVITDHDALRLLAESGTAPDLLIVDEAHELKEGGRTAVERLAQGVEHLLLLTATPRESRRARGAARARSTPFGWAVSVVDPKWPPPHAESSATPDGLLAVHASFIADCDVAIARNDRASPELKARATSLAGDLAAPLCGDIDDPRVLARQATLMERVVRTRRAQLSEQPTSRALKRVTIEYRVEEIDAHRLATAADDDDRAASRHAACSSWAALADRSSRELRGVLEPIRRARLDSKLEAFLDLLAGVWARDRSRKLVVRCEYKSTVDVVVERLRALLLGGALRESTEEEINAWSLADAVGPVARLDQSQDTIIDALVNPHTLGSSMLAHLSAFEREGMGAAPILVATDVAAVGLNLQFAQDLVFYDLPWTPGLAEQWIGRLDRVGQRGTEVSVHVLTHPAMASAPLLDVYEQIGLFSGATRVQRDADAEIEKLVRSADNDEVPWRDVVERVRALLAEEARDDRDGASLDLARHPAPDEGATHAAALAFMSALESAGFQMQRTADTVDLAWPHAGRDCVRLRETRETLRKTEPQGRNPEADARLRGQQRKLRLSLSRAPAGLARAGRDMLTARHPLVDEVARELQRDPSLALSGVRARTRDVPQGLYLVTLLAVSPGSGGEALAWRTRAAEVATDRALSRFFDMTSRGLRRVLSMEIAAEPRTCAWRLERAGEGYALGDTLEPVAANALNAVLAKGEARPVAQVVSNIEEVLQTLERPSDLFLALARTSMPRVATAFARHASLVGARLIAARERKLAGTGAGDSWRGARDAFSRELADARAFFERLERMPDHVEAAAVEASTERVSCATIVEVVR